MMSLDELKKLAKEAEYGKSDFRIHPATILELCALLEKAESALKYYDFANGVPQEALATIKQWKDKA